MEGGEERETSIPQRFAAFMRSWLLPPRVVDISDVGVHKLADAFEKRGTTVEPDEARDPSGKRLGRVVRTVVKGNDTP